MISLSSGWLMYKFRKLGIDVRTDAEVTSAERTGEGYRVAAKGPDGEISVDADLVVHAAGRKPALAALISTPPG